MTPPPIFVSPSFGPTRRLGISHDLGACLCARSKSSRTARIEGVVSPLNGSCHIWVRHITIQSITLCALLKSSRTECCWRAHELSAVEELTNWVHSGDQRAYEVCTPLKGQRAHELHIPAFKRTHEIRVPIFKRAHKLHIQRATNCVLLSCKCTHQLCVYVFSYSTRIHKMQRVHSS